MDKKNLIDAMAWDHPTRTLELGTINSNVTRALNKDHSQPGSPVLLPRIKSCLSRVVRLSSKVKRTCQIAIGLYIEQLALHHIQEEERQKGDDKEDDEKEDDEKEDDGKKKEEEREGQEVAGEKDGESKSKVLDPNDRNLLDLLCPGFSKKDLANFSKSETEQEPTTQEGLEDVDDSGDKRNIQLQFISCLLNAIYTAKRPSVKEKEVAGKATIVPGMPANVCMFIDRASDFLPEMTTKGIEVEYPGSSFLRSAAVQLCVELKKQYKNGTIDLYKKVRENEQPLGFVYSTIDCKRTKTNTHFYFIYFYKD